MWKTTRSASAFWVASACAMVLTFAAVVFLPGCHQQPAKDGKLVIGLTLPSASHPFFVFLKNSVMDEAKKLDVRVISVDAEDVAAKQLSIVEDFIAQGVDGVLMAPISADALAPAVKALNRAKIPVATVDRQVPSGDVLVHVGADNVEGGRAAARYIVEKLAGKGSVIELEGTPGASPAIDRKKGFDEALAASQIKLLASQTAEFYRANGYSVMQNLLQAHEDFQALYAANDEMVLGALKAIEEMEGKGGRKLHLVTVGYDMLPEAADAIRAGRLTASVEQFPGQQGRRGLQLLVGKLRDKQDPPSKEVFLTPIVIDKGNLDKAEQKLP